ncbi:hypothetical protein QR680_014433 [Steinernema hermaphroditum]|uniref:Uncharacterized protein n=1 Tax=Steinernema hermaphroditum TaxID=289476 RepID=A0AA39IAA0_9BILA|nr:hypothetical protein QR680_014433 [Steinernema hermaphroditum]
MRSPLDKPGTMASVVRLLLLSSMLTFQTVVHGYTCLGQNYSIALYLGDIHVIPSADFSKYSGGDDGAKMVNLHMHYNEKIKSRTWSASELGDVAKIYSGFDQNVHIQQINRYKRVGKTIEHVKEPLQYIGNLQEYALAPQGLPGKPSASWDWEWYETDANDLRKSFIHVSSPSPDVIRFADKCFVFSPDDREIVEQECSADAKAAKNPLEIVREKCPGNAFDHAKSPIELSRPNKTINQTNATVYCYSFNGCFFAYGTDLMFFDVQLLPHENTSAPTAPIPKPSGLENCKIDSERYAFFTVRGDNCLYRSDSFEAAENDVNNQECAATEVKVPKRSKLIYLNHTAAVLVGKSHNGDGNHLYSCHVVEIPDKKDTKTVPEGVAIGAIPWGKLERKSGSNEFYFKSDESSSKLEKITVLDNKCTYDGNVPDNDMRYATSAMSAFTTLSENYPLQQYRSREDSVVGDYVIQYSDNETLIYGPDCYSKVEGILIVAVPILPPPTPVPTVATAETTTFNATTNVTATADLHRSTLSAWAIIAIVVITFLVMLGGIITISVYCWKPKKPKKPAAKNKEPWYRKLAFWMNKTDKQSKKVESTAASARKAPVNEEGRDKPTTVNVEPTATADTATSAQAKVEANANSGENNEKSVTGLIPSSSWNNESVPVQQNTKVEGSINTNASKTTKNEPNSAETKSTQK